MNPNHRGSLIAGVILIGLGVLFFLLNLLPGVNFDKLWPVIFILLAAGFFIPPLLWPQQRQGLSGLFIPGFAHAASSTSNKGGRPVQAPAPAPEVKK